MAPAAVDTEFLRGGTGRESRASHIDLDAYVKMIPYVNGGMITP